jgi:ribosomal subunit interface protein
MQTTITARHCEVSDPLRNQAITVTERLGSLAARAMEMTVVFDTEGIQQTVELRLHMRTGDILVASAAGVDHRTALDRAEKKLRRQVERASERPRRTRSKQPDTSL